MPTTATKRDRIIDDDRISAYGRLVEAQRRLHRTFDRSLRARVGISIVWYEALLRLARAKDEQMPINELGEALDLSSGGATRLVDRLEENGYIERAPCPTDRRVSWAKLSDKGMDTLVDATEVHLEDLDQYFVTRLDDVELDTLNQLLRRLRPSDS